jgi:hypothetical protein
MEGSGKRPDKEEGDGSVCDGDFWKGKTCSLKTTCRAM